MKVIEHKEKGQFIPVSLIMESREELFTVWKAMCGNVVLWKNFPAWEKFGNIIDTYK